MKDWQVRLQMQAMAAMIRVEGMKAENMQRAHRGESMAFAEDDFEMIAKEVDVLAHEICID